MAGESAYVQLTWEDPATGEVQHPLLATPIAIGREKPQMPDQINGQPISRLELPNKQVSRFHALITVVNQNLCVTDHSANGTFLNGQRVRLENQPFSSKDTLRIGPYKITAMVTKGDDTNSTELNLDHTIGPSAGSARTNSLAVWLVGLLVLGVMGGGAWFLISQVLERSRPQVDPQTHQVFPGVPVAITSPTTPEG